MKFIYNLSIILLALNTVTCKSQSIDSVNINKALNILGNYYSGELDNIEFAIYNIRDKFLIIKKDSSFYELDYVSKGEGIEKKEKYSLSHKMFDRLFEISKSNDSLSILSSDNYIDDCVQSYIYFAIYNKGRKKQFEFNLPSMLLCSNKKIDYPITAEMHSFLFDLLTNYWYKK